MLRALLKTLRDLFSLNVLMFVLPIGIGSALLWFLPLWKFEDRIIQGIVSLVSWIPFAGTMIHVDKVDSFWVTLATGNILISITVAIATALFGKKLLRSIAEKNYPNFHHQGRSALIKSLIDGRRSHYTFLCMLCATFPLLFIPYFGIVWMMFLWSIQLGVPTMTRVNSLLDYDKSILKRYRLKGRLIAWLSSALNFIPIANFFTPLFAQIFYLHTVLGGEEDKAGSKL